jgi:hypothetical protein
MTAYRKRNKRSLSAFLHGPIRRGIMSDAMDRFNSERATLDAAAERRNEQIIFLVLTVFAIILLVFTWA